MNLMDFGLSLVAQARRLGADEAEIYIEKANAVTIQLAEGNVESITVKEIGGYGLRVLLDGRMGFAASNIFSADDTTRVARTLIDNTRHHTPDEHNVLPQPSLTRMADFAVPVDETLPAIPIEKKIEKAIAIETAARQTDSRITHLAWLLYGDEWRDYAIVSSTGIAHQARRSQTYGLALAVAAVPASGGHPDMATAQTGTCFEVKRRFDDLDPAVIGSTAARYAARMLGATEGATAEIEAVFPPETGCNFVGLVAQMVSADSVQKNKSLFSGKLGEMVAAEAVTMVDDGRFPDGPASAPFDDEGMPTGANHIIKNGRLVQLLYDSYTAHRAGVGPTGNAQRESYDGRPFIAPTNFYLQPGKISRDALIGTVQKGLYITEVSGLHASVDAVTGHFSIPCKGLMIERGELSYPVSGMTLSGNVFDFFRNITGLADDFTWHAEQDIIGAPTFTVAGVKITGK